MSTLIGNFFRFFFGPPALIAASACLSFAAEVKDSFKAHKIKKLHFSLIKQSYNTKTAKDRLMAQNYLCNICPFNGPLSRTTWVGRTRKVKPIWISLKQETVSDSGISWAICKCAPRSRQITMPASHSSVFYKPDALPVAQPTVSKH